LLPTDPVVCAASSDLPCFFWARGCRMFPLWRLHLGFRVVPINPRLIACDHGVQKLGVKLWFPRLAVPSSSGRNMTVNDVTKTLP
jgi:hypothetical protein